MENNKRIEPLLNRKGEIQWTFYNEEWNDPRDEDHEDYVDTYIEPKEDTTYYDDYDDYGN